MADSGDGDARRSSTKAYPTVPIGESGVGWPDEAPARAPRSGGRWFRRLLTFLVTVGVLIGAWFGLQAVNILPHFHNPFATQKTDRSGPVLLTSIQDLSRYVAAQGSFQDRQRTILLFHHNADVQWRTGPRP